MAYLFVQLAAISGLMAVALGAFGAHALKGRLTADMQAVYQTAVSYHFIHTLALLAVALLMLQLGKSTALMLSALAFVAGILVFSGSLYLLSVTGIRWLGAITPVGGVAFMLGWLALLLAMTGARP
ncbi:MAG TPA: DUF423 domain-containing protein [Pseudomonadales bacterium]